MKRLSVFFLFIFLSAGVFTGCKSFSDKQTSLPAQTVQNQEPAVVQQPAQSQEPSQVSQPTKTVPSSQAKPGLTAPDFKLRDIYQDTYILSSYKGKQPVVLLFWATWCPLCSEEIRILNQRYANIVNDGIEVLSVDVGELPDVVSDYVKPYHLAYRVLLDIDSTVAMSYKLIGFPTYIFIDTDGMVIFKDNYFSEEKYKQLAGK